MAHLMAQDAKLMIPARLVEEALRQDDFRLRLDEDEVLAPGVGSADYDRQTAQFDVAHLTSSLPELLQAEPGSYRYSHKGILPEIQRIWKSFDDRLLLWNYTDPRVPDVVEYRNVTQQIVFAQTARPKHFVQGVDFFLVLATPVEVSLHALNFERGSNCLLPIQRTRHCVATDDVCVSSIACDDLSGRIFLGSNDGCIHEFQYFDDNPVWLGRPQKSRRMSVNSTVHSWLPSVLRRITEGCAKRCGVPPAPVVQMIIDSSRGLFFALFSNSSIVAFRFRPSKIDSSGRLEEPPLENIFSYDLSANLDVRRIRNRLFPGLTARLQNTQFTQAAMDTRNKVIKMLPVQRSQGGDVALIAVLDDGSRIFLRLVYPRFNPMQAMQGAPYESQGTPTAAPSDMQAQNLQIRHVRFIDLASLLNVPVAGQSSPIRVRDVAASGGVTLLLCQMQGGDRLGATQYTDVIVAISTDLRATAQRQNRSRCPWLGAPQGMPEHLEVLQPSQGCEALALEALASPLPRALQWLYGGVRSTFAGLASPASSTQPILGLSELAQQQLLPPPRFMLVSSNGVHMLSKIRPIEIFKQQLEHGDLSLVRDFSMQYTAEQTAALCFQLLTGVIPEDTVASRYAAPNPTNAVMGYSLTDTIGDNERLNRRQNRNLSALREGFEARGGRQPSQDLWNRGNRRPPQQGATSSPTLGWRDTTEDLIRSRAEQLLLTPHLAPQVGFVQAWPLVESRGTEQMTGIPTWSNSLGHSIPLHETQRLSGRLRGLCLYLGRLLRPLWLAPIMHVVWPTRTDKKKRKLADMWPPRAPLSPPVRGAEWQCSWTKVQRSFVQEQLTRLAAVLDRVKIHLQPDLRNNPPGAPSPGSRLVNSDSRAGEQDEVATAIGLSELLNTAIEALSFLELVASRTHVLSEAPEQCPEDTLVRFAEFTFRDLVCQPAVRQVLQQLMRGGVVDCRPLHARCPRLFSAGDLEVQEACELLSSVQKSLASIRPQARGPGGFDGTVDAVRLAFLVQRALKTLDRRASQVDLHEVAAQLRAAGAYKGLVALCIRIAQSRDPNDECLRPQDPSSARVQQLHYSRLECYQVVLSILEELLSRLPHNHGAITGTSLVNQSYPNTTVLPGRADRAPDARAGEINAGDFPELVAVPVAPNDALPTLDALLRHCLEAHTYLADELFHYCILKWMLQRGLPDIVPAYRYQSPYLKGFLEKNGKDQPELLCQYFQHRGCWAEAYDAYMALGCGHGTAMAPEERLAHLQSAAVCANMSGSNRRVEPVLKAINDLRRNRC